MDAGFILAAGQTVVNPLPIPWLKLPTAPVSIPNWANFGRLTSKEIYNLLCQIGYDQSQWNYYDVSITNQLGRYHISPMTLEMYGLLLPGSNAAYGQNCVNHRQCWTPSYVRSDTNAYANYLYNTTSLWDFLSNSVAQDHLSYQIIYDSYAALTKNNGITPTDANDVVAGMLGVSWVLGAADAATWRLTGAGAAGIRAYNSGRYAVVVLSS